MKVVGFQVNKCLRVNITMETELANWMAHEYTSAVWLLQHAIDPTQTDHVKRNILGDFIHSFKHTLLTEFNCTVTLNAIHYYIRRRYFHKWIHSWQWENPQGRVFIRIVFFKPPFTQYCPSRPPAFFFSLLRTQKFHLGFISLGGWRVWSPMSSLP